MSTNDAISPLLTARHLDVTIAGRTMLRDLNLKLGSGEIIAVLGRNGSGKTTLLHTLAGLRTPADGSIELCGKSYAINSFGDLL